MDLSKLENIEIVDSRTIKVTRPDFGPNCKNVKRERERWYHKHVRRPREAGYTVIITNFARRLTPQRKRRDRSQLDAKTIAWYEANARRRKARREIEENTAKVDAENIEKERKAKYFISKSDIQRAQPEKAIKLINDIIQGDRVLVP